MKKLLFLILILSQYSTIAQTYYDIDNNKIEKVTFDKLLASKQYYYVENDSLKMSKLMKMSERDEIGTLEDVDALYRALNKKLNLNLDKTKPLIIYYYPGKDPCNSSGRATRKERIQWDKDLAKKIKKVADVNVLRIYKNNEGIKTLKDYDWKKDPNALIENLFFNYHYDCGSVVVINKDKYYATFGEYAHDNVLISLSYLLKE